MDLNSHTNIYQQYLPSPFYQHTPQDYINGLFNNGLASMERSVSAPLVTVSTSELETILNSEQSDIDQIKTQEEIERIFRGIHIHTFRQLAIMFCRMQAEGIPLSLGSGRSFLLHKLFSYQQEQADLDEAFVHIAKMNSLDPIDKALEALRFIVDNSNFSEMRRERRLENIAYDIDILRSLWNSSEIASFVEDYAAYLRETLLVNANELRKNPSEITRHLELIPTVALFVESKTGLVLDTPVGSVQFNNKFDEICVYFDEHGIQRVRIKDTKVQNWVPQTFGDLPEISQIQLILMSINGYAFAQNYVQRGRYNNNTGHNAYAVPVSTVKAEIIEYNNGLVDTLLNQLFEIFGYELPSNLSDLVVNNGHNNQKVDLVLEVIKRQGTEIIVEEVNLRPTPDEIMDCLYGIYKLCKNLTTPGVINQSRRPTYAGKKELRVRRTKKNGTSKDTTNEEIPLQNAFRGMKMYSEQ